MSKSFQILFCLSILLIEVSCHKKDDKIIFQAMEERLKNSNNLISQFTAFQSLVLEGKTEKRESMERANLWLPIARLISTFSNILFDYIEDKKSKPVLDNEDLNRMTRFLTEYKEDVLSRDSTIRQQFQNSFSFINQFIFALSQDTISSPKTLKKNLTRKEMSIYLTLLQNDIRRIENRVIVYCNQKVGAFITTFESYSAIVGQNSNILRPGEKLEIKAGIGEFRHDSTSKITINGKDLKTGPEGFVTYEMRVPSKPGKYTVPVKIGFFSPLFGKFEQRAIPVEYIVAKPCN